MVETRLRIHTRNEGTQLRPYVGLQKLEEVLAGTKLNITYEFGEYDVQFGGRAQVPHRLMAKLGYRADLADVKGRLLECLSETDIPAEKVDLVVFARDPGTSPLKETLILLRQSLEEVDETLIIVGRDAEKPRPLLNQHDGFDFEFALVLNESLPYKPLRPRLKGTILASVSTSIITTDVIGGLQPNKLTNPIRTENSLPRESWLWVNEIDSLVRSSSLSDSLAIYVDEEILRLTSLLPEDSRVLAEHVFTIPTLVQVILATSRELQQNDLRDFVFDGRNSSVLNLIYQKVKKAEGSDMQLRHFTNLMRDNPARIIAYATSDKGTMKLLRTSMSNLIGDNDDVPEN